MSEEIKNGATAETPKKVRRGVSNATQAVSQLKFHEKDACPNGLFLGQLYDVKVDYSVAGDGTTFAGLSMPRLTFHFTSQHAKVDELRHVYHTLFPIESNVATIPGGSDEWRVNSVFNFIKHILDTFYLRGRQFTEKEEDALALNFEDFDENGQYVAVDPQVVLNAYASMFNNVVAMLNGTFDCKEGETPKCCYKDANGKYVPIWMKLLRHKKRKNNWVNVGQNGELGFDMFIGAGVIELQKGNNPPTKLRIDASKESINPQETNKQPTLGGQGLAGMGAVMANPMMGVATDNTAFTAAGNGEMPF